MSKRVINLGLETIATCWGSFVFFTNSAGFLIGFSTGLSAQPEHTTASSIPSSLCLASSLCFLANTSWLFRCSSCACRASTCRFKAESMQTRTNRINTSMCTTLGTQTYMYCIRHIHSHALQSRICGRNANTRRAGTVIVPVWYECH